MLEIDYNTAWTLIQAHLDVLEKGHSYVEDEILNQTETSYIRHYLDTDGYALYGITGERNTPYALVVSSSDPNKAPVASLYRYQDILGF